MRAFMSRSIFLSVLLVNLFNSAAGVYLFMGTCFMQAIYHLLTTSVEAYLGGAVTLPFNQTVYRIRTQVHYLFLGMGIVASTAAINNVITVEFLCRFCSATSSFMRQCFCVGN